MRTPSEFRRLAVLAAMAFVAFGVVTWKVASIQFVEADALVARGEAQRNRVATVPAARGSILDRNGAELALSVPGATIQADPALVEDPRATAEALASVLGQDPATLAEILGRDSRFEYLVRQAPAEVGDEVEALELPGVEVAEEPARTNPAGDLARSVIGTVGVDHEGLSGLELRYEEELAGDPGEIVVERDPEGNTIVSGDNHYDDADEGVDLALTIDRQVQYQAERLLAEQVRATGARGGTVIVSRPATGELLAIANVDAYDDESGALVEPVPAADNRAVTAVYEPGSVNKVITLAAALEEGVVTPDSSRPVPDELLVGDHVFTDVHPHETVDMTVREVLAESSNVGTIQIAQDLGAEAIDRYLRAFGFGAPTGLDFPAEAQGIMVPPSEWSSTSIGTIPIGQGVAVSPLQVLLAFNVIANGGTYVPARLVDGFVEAGGARTTPEAPPTRQVVSAATAAQMTEMMTGVVDGGTGVDAAVEGYPVAGKTGTARKPQEGGGYEDAAGNYRYVATFAGFVPANDPQLSIIVVIDEPSTEIYGGGVAGPVFSRLAASTLRAYRIPPPASLTPVSAAG